MLNKKLLRFISLSFFIFLTHCSDSTHSGKHQVEFSFWTVGSSDINARFGAKIYDVLDSLREETSHLDEFLPWAGIPGALTSLFH